MRTAKTQARWRQWIGLYEISLAVNEIYTMCQFNIWFAATLKMFFVCLIEHLSSHRRCADSSVHSFVADVVDWNIAWVQILRILYEAPPTFFFFFFFFDCLNGDGYGKSRAPPCDIGCDEGKKLCMCVCFYRKYADTKLLHFHNWMNDDPQLSAMPIKTFNRGVAVSSFVGGTALYP